MLMVLERNRSGTACSAWQGVEANGLVKTLIKLRVQNHSYAALGVAPSSPRLLRSWGKSLQAELTQAINLALNLVMSMQTRVQEAMPRRRVQQRCEAIPEPSNSSLPILLIDCSLVLREVLLQSDQAEHERHLRTLPASMYPHIDAFLHLSDRTLAEVQPLHSGPRACARYRGASGPSGTF